MDYLTYYTDEWCELDRSGWGDMAVFGGRISGRQQKGLKVNPIYHDRSRSNSEGSQEHTQDVNGNVSNMEIVTYKTFPGTEDMVNIIEPVENGSVVNNGTSHVNVDVEIETKEVSQLNMHDSDLTKVNCVTSGKQYGHLTIVRQDCDEDLNIKETNSNNVSDSEHEHTKPELGQYQTEAIIRSKSKDYRLLGYINKAFVAEGDLVNENEQSELGNNNKPESNVIAEEGTNVSWNNSLNLDQNKCAIDTLKVSSQHSSSENSDQGRIVAEVHVHTFFYNPNESTLSREIKDTSIGGYYHTIKSNEFSGQSVNNNQPDWSNSNTLNASDWPDINDIALPITCEDITPKTGLANTNSDVIIPIPSNLHSENSKVLLTMETMIQHNEQNPETTEKIQSSASYKKNQKQSKKSGHIETNGSSSTRTLKSILSNNGSEPLSPDGSPKSEHISERSKSESEIQEFKSVKFSEDTIFNENKTKKYKLEKIEKINLREIYRGKISSDAAIAKMNPLYTEDVENVENSEQGSLTDDEKLAYKIALKKMMNSTNGKGSLNTPTYMEHYLILKAHGLKSSNLDIEQLPDEMEKPAYDRLIQRTIAKERRKLIVKWMLVFLIVAIVTAVATYLGVRFTNND